MEQKGYPMATTQQDRRDAAKDKPRQNPPKPQTTTPARMLPDISAKPSGDQKVVAPATSVDQKDTKTKGSKKKSPTVVAWQALQKEKAYISGTIHLTDKGRADNPKRKNALVKFKLYRDGMTVTEYIEASHKIGTSKATAQADVRWDVAKGLITVS
jgi:hypothetical protein